MKTRVIRRAVLGAAVGLIALTAPLPGLEFIEASVGATVALPVVEPAPAVSTAEAQAAADEPLGEDRVQALQPSAEFSVIGLQFDDVPEQPVMVRVKDPDGAFGPWQELHADLYEGPDEPASVATEPFWVGEGAGYEVNLGAADAADAEVVLVHEEQQRAVGDATPIAGAASNPLGVRSRGDWGARAPAGSIGMGSTNKLAVVHHSASSNSYSSGDVPGILRGIQAYHIDGRGWSDIAYNFVVDKYGVLWEGRAGSIDSPVIGAHAAGFNTDTVGIMVLGDYVGVGPSAAAIEGVSQITGWRLGTYGVNPAGSGTYVSNGNPRFPVGTPVNLPNVVGHGDTGYTDCPGSISNHLGAIRARAAQLSPQYATELNALGTISPFGGGFFVQGTARDASLVPNGPVTLELDGVAMGSYPTEASGRFVAGKTGVRGGDHTLCMVYRRRSDGVDVRSDCRTFRVPGALPTGFLDVVQNSGGRVYVAGWAYDPETAGSIDVHVIYDGSQSFQANSGLHRPDVGAALLPGYGPAHGFEFAMDAPAGLHTLCAVAINVGEGSNALLGCGNVVVK
jgi:hypothetical protein